jgi:hypothetical protein
MTGTYPVQDIGDSVLYGEPKTNKEEILIPLKNYTTKSKNRSLLVFKNPFKGFEIGNGQSNYDLIDLHKM